MGWSGVGSFVGVLLVGSTLAVVAPTPAYAVERPGIDALLGGNTTGEGLAAVHAPLTEAASATDTPLGETFLLDGPRLRRIDQAGVLTTLRTFADLPTKVVADGGYLYVRHGGTVSRLTTGGADTGWAEFVAGLVDFDVEAGRLYAAIRTAGSGTVATTAAGEPWTTIAGTGTAWGDDGLALDASLARVRSIAVEPGTTTVYVGQDQAVRRIADGVVTTVAGGESAPPVEGGDGGPATAASVTATYLAVAPGGVVYAAAGRDATTPAAIRRFTPGGIVETFVTASAPCPAPRVEVSATRLLVPCGAVDAYDTTTGAATRVAGSTGRGAPDGTPAHLVWEDTVSGVAPGPGGRPYYAAADRVRHLAADGTVVTVAGGGDPADGFGDGPAAGARLVPHRLAVAPDGAVHVVDRRPGAARVRRVAAGLVTTLAGGGSTAPADGGDATDAAFADVRGVAVDGTGVVWLVDQANAVWRVVDGTLDLVTTLPAHAACCDLTYDPYADRVLAVLGSSVDALDPDGTRTPVAPLVGRAGTAAAGPDGVIVDTFGWARRGDVLTAYFGLAAGDAADGSGDGGPALRARVTATQAYVAADGALVLADAEYRTVRRVDPLVAAETPTAPTPDVTPGPGLLTFTAAHPGPGGRVTVAAAEGTVPPASTFEGTVVGRFDDTSTAEDLTFDVWAVGGEHLTQQPYSFAFFYHSNDVDFLVRTVTATPLADDVAPAPPTALTLDPAADTVRYEQAADADLAATVVRWARGSVPPAAVTDGAPLPLPWNARYDDVAFAVFSVDRVGNVSAPATTVMPKLTEVAGAGSPTFTSYDSDEATGRLLVFRSGTGAVTYQAGDVAPATGLAGTAVVCACPALPVEGSPGFGVEGLTFGRHYAFATFARTADGLHFTRATDRVVFGARVPRDTVRWSATTSSSTLTGYAAFLRGQARRANGTALAGSRVEAWAKPVGATRYTRVAVGRTDGTGAFTLPVTPRINTYYQVRTGPADPAAPAGGVSGARLVRVIPLVKATVSATRVPVGRAVRVYGTVRPGIRVTLTLQRRTATGWQPVVQRPTDGYGRAYVDVVKPRGVYEYRWHLPTNPYVIWSSSPPVRFTVG